MNRLKVYISRGEKYYVAQCVEIDVVTQGKTINQIIKNLQEAIILHLEGEDLSEYNLSPNYLNRTEDRDKGLPLKSDL